MEPRYLLSHGLEHVLLIPHCFAVLLTMPLLTMLAATSQTPHPLSQNSRVNYPRILLCHRCSITVPVQTIGCSLSCGIAIHAGSLSHSVFTMIIKPRQISSTTPIIMNLRPKTHPIKYHKISRKNKTSRRLNTNEIQRPTCRLPTTSSETYSTTSAICCYR